MSRVNSNGIYTIKSQTSDVRETPVQLVEQDNDSKIKNN